MESAEAVAATLMATAGGYAPVTVSVFLENHHAAATITKTVSANADQSALLDFLSRFLPIFIAASLVAFLNYGFLRQNRRYKAADLFCVNMEKCVNEYFAAASENERKKCAVKCNVHAQGLIKLMYERNKDINDFYPHISKLLSIGDYASENDIDGMRNALNAVVQIRSLLIRW